MEELHIPLHTHGEAIWLLLGTHQLFNPPERDFLSSLTLSVLPSFLRSLKGVKISSGEHDKLA